MTENDAAPEGIRFPEQEGVPQHLRTWRVLVRGKVVELPRDGTIREIRGRLPSDLVEER